MVLFAKNRKTIMLETNREADDKWNFHLIFYDISVELRVIPVFLPCLS